MLTLHRLAEKLLIYRIFAKDNRKFYSLYNITFPRCFSKLKLLKNSGFAPQRVIPGGGDTEVIFYPAVHPSRLSGFNRKS